MSLPLSWGEIVLRVENSGIQELEKQRNDHKTRNMLLRADWSNQVQELSAKKRMQQQQKPFLRVHAEMLDAIAHQKQKRLKSEAKQRESIFKNKNMEMIEKHALAKKGYSEPKYGQNPMTWSITKGYEERERKSREKNIEFSQINSKLIQQKELLQKAKYDLESLERKRFQNYIDQTFKRKDEQRYAFKRACLDGRTKRAQTYTMPNTVHDSLEREYATYLNGQIAEKKNLRQSEMTYSRIKVNQSQLKNVHNMNSKVEEQNSSPAYLGRIPLSHDRQKQLSYLDKQLKFRQRIKTQNPQVSYVDNPKQVSKFPQVNEINYLTQASKQVGPSPGSNSGDRNREIKRKGEMREYRQLNILTGSHNTHYI